MKGYIVDAQLPRKLATWLATQGYNAIHTLDLPRQNATADVDIIEFAELNQLVVVTKDKDFPHHRIIHQRPTLLLWVTTGNLTNTALLELFSANFPRIHQLFREGHQFIELSNEVMLLHN